MNLGWMKENVKAYIKAHGPDTGYSLNAVLAVIDAAEKGLLPAGANVAVQIALQYDGKETKEDLVVWAAPEKRLPYGGSWSLDYKADCIDFIRNLKMMLFGGKNPGNWSEGMYQNYKNRFIRWEDRRPFDAILYLIGDRNPHATHGSLIVNIGSIIHTTSRSNPLRVDDIMYAYSKVVGVCRIITDEEYASVIVPGDVIPIEGEEDMLTLYDPDKEAVKKLQAMALKLGADLGDYGPLNDGVDGILGPKTAGEIQIIQERLNVVTAGGEVGMGTIPTILAMQVAISAFETVGLEEMQMVIDSLRGKIEDGMNALRS